jgi:4-hydroxy-3-polyprenylbenzoate decarboxylase
MTEAPETAPIAVAMTGASGAQYGLRLIETLLDAEREVHLVISATGRAVINTETDCRIGTKPQQVAEQLIAYYGRSPTARLQVFAEGDWFAPMASGSNPPAAVVICPCTMGTLAAIANGLSRSLIDRAADVALKEKRKLIVVPRETPLSTIHLNNMTTLAREGAVILPPSPGFYHQPKTIEAMIDFVVARILDHLAIEHDLMIKWGQDRLGSPSSD